MHWIPTPFRLNCGSDSVESSNVNYLHYGLVSIWAAAWTVLKKSQTQYPFMAPAMIMFRRKVAVCGKR